MSKTNCIRVVVAILLLVCGAAGKDNPCLSTTPKGFLAARIESMELQPGTAPPHTFGGHFLQFAKEFGSWRTDLQVVVAPAATAGMSQLVTSHAGFVSGPEGFGKHYGVNLIGEVSGRFLSHFLMPALFHQDARYIRKGAGQGGLAGFADRLAHVGMHAIYAPADEGSGASFNWSNIPGSVINSALSNTYQPDAQRTALAAGERVLWGMLGYTASDVYGEFAPCFISEDCKKAPPVPSKITVDFSQLSPESKTLFSTCCGAQDVKKWSDLGDTQQLEYAGVTQALQNWAKFEPDAGSPKPGLETLSGVDVVCGSIEEAPSADQFNLHVKWEPGAEKKFGDAQWGTHIPWLHPGMHGYQQNVDGDPFLGLVVLFPDKDDPERENDGQVHIDFRDFPGHYFPANGDLSQNYSYYCDWYGKLEAYNGLCAANEQVQAVQASPVAPKAQFKAQPATPDIYTTVRKFLKAWYIDHDDAALQSVTAHDSVYAQQTAIRQLGPRAATPAASTTWKNLFDTAFNPPSGIRAEALRPRGLGQVIARPPVTGAISSGGAGPRGALAEDPFLVLDPKELPAGSLFPSNTRSEHLSLRAQYLNHIRETYPIYVVVYTTKSRDLIPETAILYWIEENGSWKLGMYQGLQ